MLSVRDVTGLDAIIGLAQVAGQHHPRRSRHRQHSVQVPQLEHGVRGVVGSIDGCSLAIRSASLII